MDEEEVLRLCQVSGLEDLFSDSDFSRAWESSTHQGGDWEDVTDEVSQEVVDGYRAANTDDESRIFHTYDKWECHKAGFFASSVPDKTAEMCKQEYAEFLSDLDRFRASAELVTDEWTHSCEHYLTNSAMNRIAWIGQAAMCYATGIPSKFCGGFNLLTDQQKEDANLVALEVLNDWLLANAHDPVEMDAALGGSNRQIELY